MTICRDKIAIGKLLLFIVYIVILHLIINTIIITFILLFKYFKTELNL